MSEEEISHPATSTEEGTEKRFLDEFQKEIVAIVAKEAQTKQTDHFTTGDVFNPAELTETDREMWLKVKNPEIGIVSKDDFEKYRAEVAESKSISRDRFAQFLANKLSVVWGREELRRFRKAA